MTSSMLELIPLLNKSGSGGCGNTNSHQAKISVHKRRILHEMILTFFVFICIWGNW
jgi:hypothetical protein